MKYSTYQQRIFCFLVACPLLLGTLVQAVFVPTQLPDPSRRWSVSATVLSGWDDNIYSRPDGPDKISSATTTFMPVLYVYIPLDQSFFGMRYTHDSTYYWDRTGGDNWDRSHIVDMMASHRFNNRLQLDITDSFRRGTRPELVDLVNNVPYIRQQQGDYYYNNLNASLNYKLTQLWTLIVGNAWEYWAYDKMSDQDRNIYSPNIGLSYILSPSTTIGANFRIGIVDYSNPGINDGKNSITETAYLSLTHLFNPQLTGQIGAGASRAEFGDNTTSTSPYFSGNLSYQYCKDGTVSLGTSYFLNPSVQNFYRSSGTLATFVQVNHTITRKLIANLSATHIYSTMGNLESSAVGTSESTDTSWRLGLGLTYACTRWLSLEANYSYETIDSDMNGRGYDRNRVWGGVRVTY
jgi:opacity protein-like surface antigen